MSVSNEAELSIWVAYPGEGKGAQAEQSAVLWALLCLTEQLFCLPGQCWQILAGDRHLSVRANSGEYRERVGRYGQEPIEVASSAEPAT